MFYLLKRRIDGRSKERFVSPPSCDRSRDDGIAGSKLVFNIFICSRNLHFSSNLVPHNFLLLCVKCKTFILRLEYWVKIMFFFVCVCGNEAFKNI